MKTLTLTINRCIRNMLSFLVMVKSIYPHYRLQLIVCILAFVPTKCLAMSYPNSPCNVGDGFFFYKPSHNNFSNEGWHIYFENGSQKTICYHIDMQNDDAKLGTPEYYDFDEKWVYIQASYYGPNDPEQPQSERTEYQVYFLFNKGTREMSGPLAAAEFFEHPSVASKVFHWKRADYKDTRGFGWFALIMLFLLLGGPYILLAILLGILGKWVYELFVYLHKKQKFKENT